MIFKIKISNENYRYDVYQIFNLFYPLDNIIFVKDMEDYNVLINDESIEINDKIVSKNCTFEKELSIKENVKKGLYLFLNNKTGKALPWGTLIGIRPTKKATEFINKGKALSEFQSYLKVHSVTRSDKAELCYKIARKEKEYINKNSKTISIYIDMPFCPTRCLYCSFTSNPIKKCVGFVDDYLNALIKEIHSIRDYIEEKSLKIQCVYFGGGTPTAIDEQQFSKIMKEIYECFILNNHVQEYTVECGRPDSITINKLSTMKKYGVSRISINPQTMNDETLKVIGRNHSSEDIKNVFLSAREMGFDNINMDLIIGLPGEGLLHMEKTCNEILKLGPDNITVHGLCIKRGSKLYDNILSSCDFDMADQKEIDEMYKCVESLTKKLNMESYYMYRQKNMVGNMENVGYCINGKEGIYNIEMIEEKQTIIGLGADAVTKVLFLEENRLERFPNIKDVKEYISRIDEKIYGKISLLNTLYKEV